ncbi:hypothetical protein [Streptomyces cyanogenus]|uniref:Integral membrane protein n=1 Tax=Streptomyces cyanogenus TaxID=80860 RepID=A0ABX7TWU7_STRCY|nr:hypothetical protein [Streptomyces cyanogenus]QTE01213.1 hypothetical protein S1361_28045 [Streptomyces cyanogenus]
MLALRLTRASRPAVQLRRLLVAAASAGTGFLLLSCLGHALNHPEAADAAALRLAWCALPLAATVYLAVAVARTDPGTRPRPGLSAVGLGPARLMAYSALTTALSCTLGSLFALLVFLHLRGDLTGLPFDRAAAGFLAAGHSLPAAATLTLLSLLPATATTTVALALRPTDPHPPKRTALRLGRFRAHGDPASRETFGAYGRFGTHFGRRRAAGAPAQGTGGGTAEAVGGGGGAGGGGAEGAGGGGAGGGAEAAGHRRAEGAGGVGAAGAGGGGAAGAGGVGAAGAGGGRAEAAGHRRAEGAGGGGAAGAGGGETAPGAEADPGPTAPDAQEAPPADAPVGLPWGVALVTAGLAVQAYAGRSTPAPSLAVLLGWLLTATGIVLASPGLTHLCGRLLQCSRPGVLRLLAGRGLMAEAARIGRPLGVVCTVASAGYAMTALYDDPAPVFGPLSALGALVVAGSTVATLLTAAVEARQCRADTTAALLRLGAPATMLRAAAVLRAAALLALFGPLVVAIATLSALPLSR